MEKNAYGFGGKKGFKRMLDGDQAEKLSEK